MNFWRVVQLNIKVVHIDVGLGQMHKSLIAEITQSRLLGLDVDVGRVNHIAFLDCENLKAEVEEVDVFGVILNL